MKYFKNTELAKLYNVSEKSVRNWIQAAKEGKLELTLHTENGKAAIANTTRNTTLIEELVQKGKKYKNTRGLKTIVPSPVFYERFTPRQVLDIISNIDIHREIPYQYNYFNGGAVHWDLYTQRLIKEGSSNYLTDIIELLTLNRSYFNALTAKYKHINIVDVGLGNCLPVREFLHDILKQGKLKRYIGIDTSPDMLDIAERNINKWFDGKVSFEGYVRDINHDRFDDLLADESFGAEAESTLNVVLFLGSTIVNFRDPDSSLRAIHDSMGKRDLLLFSIKLDSERSRRYFDFTTERPDSMGNFRGKDLLTLLNINESLYELDQAFSEEEMMRRTQIRFKVATSIEFQYNGQSKLIHFNKGETLLLWRAVHQGNMRTLQQFDHNGFNLLQAMRSTDQESILLTAKVKSGFTS